MVEDAGRVPNKSTRPAVWLPLMDIQASEHDVQDEYLFMAAIVVFSEQFSGFLRSAIELVL